MRNCEGFGASTTLVIDPLQMALKRRRPGRDKSGFRRRDRSQWGAWSRFARRARRAIAAGASDPTHSRVAVGGSAADPWAALGQGPRSSPTARRTPADHLRAIAAPRHRPRGTEHVRRAAPTRTRSPWPDQATVHQAAVRVARARSIFSMIFSTSAVHTNGLASWL